MTVKALMPVHDVNLVMPLAHEATAMCTTETGACDGARSGTVSASMASSLRRGDVDSMNQRSTPRATPGTRTSTTATRTTTTRLTRPRLEPSADSSACTFEELVAAYVDCRRDKRNSTSALAFEECLERNLCDLYEELAGGHYRPGPSICFVITRPKPREVWAAQFRDRIAHHLLYNRIAPRFHAGFIADTCACIPGRGTLYAALRLERHIRSITQNWQHPAYYLKCDLANFFVAIDKRVVFELLCRRLGPGWWQELASTILFHDPRANVEVRGDPALLARIPPHKSLFNAPDHMGLPIGNLSSQFFANVYLDPLDQFAKHQLRARRYVRYVDDFILLHESAQWLYDALARISEFLPAQLGATLNPAKTIMQPIDRGVDFVGQVVKPWRRVIRTRTMRSSLERLKAIETDVLFAAGNSYLGLARQASHGHVDQARIANLLRRRGHCVAGDLSKIFRKSP